MKLGRLVVVAALALGLGACGEGDSPADRVTQPIDRAEDTADVANQREQQLESQLSDP